MPDPAPGLKYVSQNMDPERPDTFPEEAEWKSPPRTKAPQSLEATTLVTNNNCRKCGHTRTEVVPYCCQWGNPYVDSDASPPDTRTAVMLDVRPRMNKEDEEAYNW